MTDVVATRPGPRADPVARTARITGAASAVPPSMDQEQLWTGFFGPRLKHSRWAHRVFTSSGAIRRHPAVDPTIDDVSGWSTGARMERYLAEAMPLGQRAVSAALARANLAAGDVGLFAVASCTGYTTPGVDIHLARDLGMDPSTQRLLIGHMGCYAALPALGAVSDYVVARKRPAVLLCIELSSLHVQPESDDMQQLVAHSLFSDAAAAVVVQPADPGLNPAAGSRLDAAAGPLLGSGPGAVVGPGALEVVEVAARTDGGTTDHMTWDITDLGFRMGLSRRVPDVLALHVKPLVEGLLATHGVGIDEVAGWAVHPGGPRILDVVADRLGLDAEAMSASRHVLAEHGNCSSATVLLVLEELRAQRSIPAGGYVVAIAFGPGLTLYATLLRA